MQATRTVERVGRRIAEASGLEGCKWEFIVVRDKTLNAFALPGGKVRHAVDFSRKCVWSQLMRSGPALP